MGGTYDAAEPKTAYDAYQDYGHNHWHNSLIWGEGISDISITGPGLICGKGLSFGAGPGRAPGPRAGCGSGAGRAGAAAAAAPGAGASGGRSAAAGRRQVRQGAAAGRRERSCRARRGNYPMYQAEQAGVGNKSIALKNCRNVTLSDFSILKGGHFGIAADGRGQPDDRQPEDRHRPRRHGHRLLQERARVELHGELAVG